MIGAGDRDVVPVTGRGRLQRGVRPGHLGHELREGLFVRGGNILVFARGCLRKLAGVHQHEGAGGSRGRRRAEQLPVVVDRRLHAFVDHAHLDRGRAPERPPVHADPVQVEPSRKAPRPVQRLQLVQHEARVRHPLGEVVLVEMVPAAERVREEIAGGFREGERVGRDRGSIGKEQRAVEAVVAHRGDHVAVRCELLGRERAGEARPAAAVMVDQHGERSRGGDCIGDRVGANVGDGHEVLGVAELGRIGQVHRGGCVEGGRCIPGIRRFLGGVPYPHRDGAQVVGIPREGLRPVGVRPAVFGHSDGVRTRRGREGPLGDVGRGLIRGARRRKQGATENGN